MWLTSQKVQGTKTKSKHKSWVRQKGRKTSLEKGDPSKVKEMWNRSLFEVDISDGTMEVDRGGIQKKQPTRMEVFFLTNTRMEVDDAQK